MEKSCVSVEDSLKRTHDLGREVLERARRRDVDWWSAPAYSGRSPRSRHGAEIPERASPRCLLRHQVSEMRPELLQEERPTSLEEAFSALSRFMRQATEQCERYHSGIPARVMNRSERQHVSRFHCRKPQRTPPKPQPALISAAAPLQSSGRTRDPRDVCIEVAPGTYSISAGAPNYRTQTHLVHITPGQSVDLTFHV